MAKISRKIGDFLLGWMKKPRVRYSSPMNYFRSIFTLTQRETMLKNAASFIAVNKVEGDYLEFGVWKGSSFTQFYNFAKKHKKLKNMRFYAFDSFEGLPESKESDLEMGSMDVHNWHKGKYSSEGVKGFLKSVKKGGVNLKRVSCIPGWYDDTLNDETKKKLSIKKAAVVYIDCDLYESTVPVLNFITDYVTEGTVILFDDWYNYKGNPEKGEQKAFYEWLKKNPSIKAVEFQKIGGKYNSFTLYKKE